MGDREQGKCFYAPLLTSFQYRTVTGEKESVGVFWHWSKELLAAYVSQAAGGQQWIQLQMYFGFSAIPLPEQIVSKAMYSKWMVTVY